MSSKKVAVVIPHHKEELNDFEKISLAQVQKVLGYYSIIFFAPEGKNFSYIPQCRQMIRFPVKFFKGLGEYNSLMLDKVFYKQFLDYDFILLYQLDAFVFSDKLEHFCSLGYDNIGAVWPYMWGTSVRKVVGDKKVILHSGNGGFCLRNVENCYNLLEKHKNLAENWNGTEDNFFAYCGIRQDIDFKNAPVNVAYSFAAEFIPERVTKKNGGELPFGCHAFYRYSADFYFRTLKQFGYDLTALKNQMLSQDIDNLQRWLEWCSLARAAKRILSGKNISFYADRDFYFSIHVLKGEIASAISEKIFAENKIACNKIFSYSPDELENLVRDLKKVKKTALVITQTTDEDRKVITELQKNNIKFKGKIEFFNHSRLKYHEKIFHNLGK